MTKPRGHLKPVNGNEDSNSSSSSASKGAESQRRNKNKPKEERVHSTQMSKRNLFLDPEVDGRRKEAYRFKAIFMQTVEDLGGLDEVTEAQKQLARRVAGLAVMLEVMETEMALGNRISMEEYTKATNSLRQVLSTLGIKRVPKEVGEPDLHEHLSKYRRGGDQ